MEFSKTLIFVQGRVLCIFICTLMLLLCFLMALVELLKIALIIIENVKDN
ncbi:MAG: hypothetical protein ACLTL6_16860 [Holdemanella porci]